MKLFSTLAQVRLLCLVFSLCLIIVYDCLLLIAFVTPVRVALIVQCCDARRPAVFTMCCTLIVTWYLCPY